MAVLEGGVSAALAGVGAESLSPLHVRVTPLAYGALGHYVAQGLSGTIAAGAAALSEIFQLRYTGANLCVVYSVVLEHFSSLAAAFTGGIYRFVLTRATAWTADGTGGATVTPLKMRSSMGNAVATFRIPTTAALGGGTKTFDASDLRERRGIISTAINGLQFAQISAAANITVGICAPQQLVPDEGITAAAHPIILANNEGLIIRATVPGSGTWEVGATFRFAEVVAF